ncbi:hypothetical protein [uncultured Mediterranean phage uvMED]|nr:hypothetical protein [uncultured Mediterranean phage uvMED]
MVKLKEVYCKCKEIKLNGKNRWIANVENYANLETQCPSCRECVSIKGGEFVSCTPMGLKFSKKK